MSSFNAHGISLRPAVLHLLLVAALLSGCSGPPSESAGQKLLEHRIAEQSHGNIRLVRFTKTNATGNDQLYQMEFEAEVEFVANGAWSRGNAMDPVVHFDFSPEQVSGNAIAQLMGSIEGAANVRQGQHQTIRSVLRFEKTESGWRGEDGNIY
jgi:hypothetical protein